ncbi:MAG: glycosyltransferase family 2 protein [Flavobacteriales bacterium]|nr:glycosyltransferase family 2 protein [Flavobacteriales bacterium]MCB9447767.1 glycosyltransferase family 2 protein [Flavobacteriales bacterium]
MKYYVITPAKNEEAYIRLTLDSMAQQTLKPEKWIIVDDGSTDNTGKIVKEYADRFPWIAVMTLDNKGEQRSYGSKVIRAFNKGYANVPAGDYGFIVKLDADLSFPPSYFEYIAKAFDADPKVGICGGIIVENEGDFDMKVARHPRVEGALKAICKPCWDAIGGFVEENGWDGLDLLHAQYLGWKVANIPVPVKHHRPEAAEYKSLKFFYNNGITHYRQRNDVWLTLVRGAFMMKKKPYISASMSYLRGYFGSWIRRKPRLVDKGLGKFIRTYHYQRLFSFKR